VKLLAEDVDLVLVLGSDNSSNSRRLREVAEGAGAKAFLIDDATEIKPEWLEGVECVAITAGASAPEYLVQQVLDYFRALGAENVEEVMAIDEKVTFLLPPELSREMTARGLTQIT
jgi:4-hydroxy-3-methylbut-2-enyl diphosphate reductase